MRSVLINILLIVSVATYGQFGAMGGHAAYVTPTASTEPAWDGDIYYVATDGSNSAAGTSEATAWATVSYAVSTSSGVVAGDSIYVEAGDYGSEQIEFEISGEAGSYIVIQGYKTTPGDQPKEDWTYGDAYITTEMPYYEHTTRNSGSFLDFNTQEYIKVKNFQTYYYEFIAYVDGEHNIVENIYSTEYGDLTNRGSNGIHLWGSTDSIEDASSWANSSAHSSVINCTLVNGTEQGIWVWSDSCTIEDCEVYCDITLSWEAGLDYYIIITGRGNTVDGCHVERVSSSVAHYGHGIGIKGSWLEPKYEVTGPSNNTIKNCSSVGMRLESFWVGHDDVHDNLFENCTIDGERQGVVCRDSAYNNTFQNFEIKNIDTKAAIVWRDGSEGIEGNSSVDNKFYNFTVYDCFSVLDVEEGDSDALGNWESEAFGNELYNFTVYNCDYFIGTISGVNSDNVMKNWIAQSVTDDYYYLTETDNFAFTYSNFYSNGFTAPSGTGNITTDPDMTDPANDDFTLSVGSGAIDAGIDVGLDYNGTAPDMGANESD